MLQLRERRALEIARHVDVRPEAVWTGFRGGRAVSVISRRGGTYALLWRRRDEYRPVPGFLRVTFHGTLDNAKRASRWHLGAGIRWRPGDFFRP